MKRTLSSLLFAAVALCGAAFAQGPDGPPAPPSASDRVARLTTLLNLTTAQQAQATTIFTSEQTAMEQLHTQIQTARTNLTAAIKSNTAATIDLVSSQLGAYEGQAANIRSKAQAAFYAILTTDQQTKLGALPEGAIRGPRMPE